MVETLPIPKLDACPLAGLAPPAADLRAAGEAFRRALRTVRLSYAELTVAEAVAECSLDVGRPGAPIRRWTTLADLAGVTPRTAAKAAAKLLARGILATDPITRSFLALPDPAQWRDVPPRHPRAARHAAALAAVLGLALPAAEQYALGELGREPGLPEAFAAVAMERGARAEEEGPTRRELSRFSPIARGGEISAFRSMGPNRENLSAGGHPHSASAASFSPGGETTVQARAITPEPCGQPAPARPAPGVDLPPLPTKPDAAPAPVIAPRPAVAPVLPPPVAPALPAPLPYAPPEPAPLVGPAGGASTIAELVAARMARMTAKAAQDPRCAAFAAKLAPAAVDTASVPVSASVEIRNPQSAILPVPNYACAPARHACTALNEINAVQMQAAPLPAAVALPLAAAVAPLSTPATAAERAARVLAQIQTILGERDFLPYAAWWQGEIARHLEAAERALVVFKARRRKSEAGHGDRIKSPGGMLRFYLGKEIATATPPPQPT